MMANAAKVKEKWKFPSVHCKGLEIHMYVFCVNNKYLKNLKFPTCLYSILGETVDVL